MRSLSAICVFSVCSVGAFRCSPAAVHHRTVASSSSLKAESSLTEVAEDDLEETVLRINFSYSTSSTAEDEKNGSLALAAVQKYTRSFPFAAVLPVQPLTYIPVKISNGKDAVKVTFLRKKTAEKGSEDGGMVFSSSLVSEEDYEDGTLDNYKKGIQLVAQRITKGQTISKIFSEKQIVMAFVKGLSEERGVKILVDGGNVEVESVFHLWM